MHYTEGLKSYPRHTSTAKLQMQKMQEIEQLANVQGLPNDRNTLNKLMAMHPGMNGISNHHVASRGPPINGSAQAALALTSYQNLLMRQNSINSNSSSHQQDPASTFNNPSPSPSSNFQSSATFVQNIPSSSFSSPQISSPLQPQQRSSSANSLLLQQNNTSLGNPALQQQMIQQLLQEMSNNGGQNGNNGSFGRNGFKNPSSSDSTYAGGGGNSGFNQKVMDLPHLNDDMVPDMAHGFSDNGFLNSDIDDNMSYVWKA